MEYKFSKWYRWEDRRNLSGLQNPGVYCIAISESDLSDVPFEWNPEIKYIGMTNSKAGLKGRLLQFDNTIKGKEGHGGALRFRFQYRNYKDIISKLFVSVCFFECNVESNKPKDLLIMGEVEKFEYVCFADYVTRFNVLPEFNDKSKSPKDR